MCMARWQLPSKGTEANRTRENRKSVSRISLLAFSNPICPKSPTSYEMCDCVQEAKVRGKSKTVIAKMNAAYSE